tara:strand:- start:42 stop:707 length:666 start_codon:yes stop_codon:yes gene_type:complete
MKVLVACEESQAVTIELRKLGHEAFSCDILECSGGYPEWHIKGDVLEQLNKGWDMMIAFPPCTYLTVTGNKWFNDEYKDRFPTRQQDRKEGIEFFLSIANAPIEKIAIENPVGIMSTKWRKADQVIQPYYFGDSAQKTTCLWLKNLPHLYHNDKPNLFDQEVTHVERENIVVSKGGNRMGAWYYQTGLITLKNGLRAKARSKTFPGIAKAMANQWGCMINK